MKKTPNSWEKSITARLNREAEEYSNFKALSLKGQETHLETLRSKGRYLRAGILERKLAADKQQSSIEYNRKSKRKR